MRILIVKLGAMGDVLRTTPLLRAYKSRYPSCHISWVVDRWSFPVLESNPWIDRLLVWDRSLGEKLSRLEFDLALNLDKEKEALDTIESVRAVKKMGFGWNRERTDIGLLNPASAYAVRLGKDDELKFFRNKKTYQEISFEQAEMPYRGEEYILELSGEERSYASEYLARLPRACQAPTLIGINTGSGRRFAGKSLPEEHIVGLSRRLARSDRCHALLLGGPEEKEKNVRLEKSAMPFATNGGTHHTIRQFAAIVERLGVVLSGDTIAMHVGIAMKVPTVAFFGSTAHAEIDLYGRGVKIVSDIECSPCYKRVCPIQEKCMSDLSIETLSGEIDKVLAKSRESIRQ